MRLLAGFRELASVPVAIHFDHATDESQIISALDMRAGNRNAFDSVLIDGSRLTYEENAVWTAKMVSWCQLIVDGFLQSRRLIFELTKLLYRRSWHIAVA